MTSFIPLGDRPGPKRIRLRFSSDGIVQQNGWFIEYIAISGNFLDIKSDIPETVKGLEITETYPNPFNGILTVRYSLPETSPAKIVIYDQAGRTVKVLPTTILNAGINSLSIATADLSSGVYYLSLTQNKQSVNKKIVVLK